MARVPSRQFCPATAIFDSFQSSFSKFHGTHFHFFSWLDKWNKPNKYNSLKRPPARVNYRKNNGNGVGGVDDGGSTMGKIVEKLKKFGYVGDSDGEGKEKRE
ncbi:hypothetical protein WN943_028963 [Citrus x changshan-huyou]